MTLRELLSCMDEGKDQKITLIDYNYKEICLKICFNCDPDFAWVFEEDMETLEQLSDLRVSRWYIAYGSQLRVYLDADFEEVLG